MHTLIVSHLELSKVVPKHPIVCVVAVVVGRAALFSGLADSVQLLRLRRAKVLSLRGRLPLLVVADWVAIAVVLVRLAVELLCQIRDPARHCLLRLLEPLFESLANLREFVCPSSAWLYDTRECRHTIEEAMLAFGLSGPLAWLLPPLLALRTCAALILVVFGQLSRVYLVLLELGALRSRWLRRGSLFGLEVGVRHACPD
jgi:hypothetical protein